VAADGVAVVGGGIIGCSIAWRLAQRGWPVTLFEKGSLGEEASTAGAGMLSPGGEVERPSDLAALTIESRALYTGFVQELQEISGLAIDYQECGGLDLAYSPSELTALQARALRQATFGIRAKQLRPADVASFWPGIRTTDLAGAFFYPNDAIVNSREVMVALAAACRRAGVAVCQNTPVDGIAIDGETTVLNTVRGKESFRAVVIAAGAWSGSIAVKGLPKLPSTEPIKGHLIGYQQPQGTCSTIVRYGPTYLLQRANGLLICGASLERVGFDRSIDATVVALLAERAGFIFPHLHETTPSEVWTGFRPGSESLRMGRWHSPHLYLAYGHFRNGILLAPVTAERIAMEVTANLRTQ